MRLDNVFYGFTKNGERKLLWKKYKVEITSLGDIERTVYYDLENKEYIEPNTIDEDTLVSINKIVGNYKGISKRKVIKAYKADCNILYDVKGTFYGSILYKKRGKEILEIENVLLARIADPECRVQWIKNGGLYPWIEKIEKGVGVKENRPIKTEIFSDKVVTKKKMLEADYKKLL